MLGDRLERLQPGPLVAVNRAADEQIDAVLADDLPYALEPAEALTARCKVPTREREGLAFGLDPADHLVAAPPRDAKLVGQGRRHAAGEHRDPDRAGVL